MMDVLYLGDECDVYDWDESVSDIPSALGDLPVSERKCVLLM